MAEEQKEKWTNYLAITTVLIAVCATLSTFKGGGYSNRSLMCQTKASDQWAFFQSKSVKGYIFEMQKSNLELQREQVSKSNDSKFMIPKYEKKIMEYDKKIKQYEAEKKDITKEANAFLSEMENCKKHASAFGVAVIFLQISILLSSISALTKRKYVWIVSLLVGVLGVFYFMNGFLLFLE
ncbi:MAG: DUF4337 domain-containing protein [Bacteroidota bacterium]|nr:DUF4337 domain-containing protein [Bacteroidota bacterium]MDP4206067.1 DUF4337 domain-containing protein [Bacteroidota bacterium]